MSKTILAQVNGFTPLISSIVKAYGLVTAAVFGQVWRYCQMEDGVCRASQETIASDLGLSRPTINQHIETLCKNGFLLDTTPAVKNAPHVYADTGKAGLTANFTAFNSEIGVKQLYTSDSGGVKELYTGVKQIDTRCKAALHPGVKQLYTIKDSLRESLRKNKEETLNALWSMVNDQLKGEMKPGTYHTWVRQLRAIDLVDDTLIILAPDHESSAWVQSNLGRRIERLVEGIAQEPISVTVNAL